MKRFVSQKIRLTPTLRAGVGHRRPLVRPPRGLARTPATPGACPTLAPAPAAAVHTPGGTRPAEAGTRRGRRSSRARSWIPHGPDDSRPPDERADGASTVSPRA